MNQTIESLPAELRTLAATWVKHGAPDTVRERENAVRAIPRTSRGGLSIRAARMAVDEALDAADRARESRPYRRIVSGLGYVPIKWGIAGKDVRALYGYAPHFTGYTWRTPKHGTQDPDRARSVKKQAERPADVRERLYELRREAVSEAHTEAGIRYGAAGGSSFRVVLTDDPKKVGYEVDLRQNWSTYRGRYKGWSAREDHHVVTVPRDWRLRVERRGLAVVDGLMTLDAQPLEGAPRGVALYAAVWVVQGRGYEARSVRGYIARANELSYHGRTPEEALSGLQRKLRRHHQEAEWQAALALPDEVFVAKLAALGEATDRITVGVTDARATGSCEYGIRSWCHAVGLDYEAGSATLSDVIAAYRRRPVREARFAILHALRRQRVRSLEAA